MDSGLREACRDGVEHTRDWLAWGGRISGGPSAISPCCDWLPTAIWVLRRTPDQQHAISIWTLQFLTVGSHLSICALSNTTVWCSVLVITVQKCRKWSTSVPSPHSSHTSVPSEQIAFPLVISFRRIPVRTLEYQGLRFLQLHLDVVSKVGFGTKKDQTPSSQGYNICCCCLSHDPNHVHRCTCVLYYLPIINAPPAMTLLLESLRHQLQI